MEDLIIFLINTTCRKCHKTKKQNEMIKPCKCSGVIHRKCLKKQIAERKNSENIEEKESCPDCHVEYRKDIVVNEIDWLKVGPLLIFEFIGYVASIVFLYWYEISCPKKFTEIKSENQSLYICLCLLSNVIFCILVGKTFASAAYQIVRFSNIMDLYIKFLIRFVIFNSYFVIIRIIGMYYYLKKYDFIVNTNVASDIGNVILIGLVFFIGIVYIVIRSTVNQINEERAIYILINRDKYPIDYVNY